MGALERFDNFATVRNRVRTLAERAEEWAGIPIPVDGNPLIIEPSYPFAKALSGGKLPMAEDPPDAKMLPVRAQFWSSAKRIEIAILQRPDGKCVGTWIPGSGTTADKLLMTLSASVAWGIEQEQKALATLGGMLRHHMFKAYLLTGMFLETSQRSGVTYVFRRLRPTLALRTSGDRIRILTAMCMHPIGYYASSWAGAMCPTDDVIAHLSLMRGDEPMFWRRCNQHPAYHPLAGV